MSPLSLALSILAGAAPTLPSPTPETRTAAIAPMVRAQEQSPSATGVAPRARKWDFGLDLLVGGTRWLWGEEVPVVSDLREDGVVVQFVARAELAHRQGLVFGAGLENLSGAVDYEGYLQNSDDPAAVDGLLPYNTSTHYLYVEPDFSLRKRFPLGSAQGSLGARLSFPWWRRTIDSRTDSKPGKHGYIEEWSQSLASPEVGIRFGGDSAFVRTTVTASLSLPLETHESIGSGPNLRPEAGVGKRLRLTLEFPRGILLEGDWYDMKFGKSDPLVALTNTGSLVVVYQPASSVDRISVRAGIRI